MKSQIPLVVANLTTAAGAVAATSGDCNLIATLLLGGQALTTIGEQFTALETENAALKARVAELEAAKPARKVRK